LEQRKAFASGGGSGRQKKQNNGASAAAQIDQLINLSSVEKSGSVDAGF
jgi:hypothetical protein